MKRITISIIVALIFMSIIFGLILIPPHKLAMNFGVDVCAGNNDEYCYANLAKETGDADICEYYLNEANKLSNCYVYASVPTLNPEPCTRLETENAIQSCYFTAASFSQNIFFCDQIEALYGSSTNCYSNVVRMTGDTTQCDNSPEKDPCLFNAMIHNIIETKDITICDNLNESFYNEVGKQLCYNQLAWEINNKSLCDKVYTEPFKTSCLNEFN